MKRLTIDILKLSITSDVFSYFVKARELLILSPNGTGGTDGNVTTNVDSPRLGQWCNVVASIQLRGEHFEWRIIGTQMMIEWRQSKWMRTVFASISPSPVTNYRKVNCDRSNTRFGRQCLAVSLTVH